MDYMKVVLQAKMMKLTATNPSITKLCNTQAITTLRVVKF